MNSVGELIYNRRKELGLTLEEVGNAVGVSKSTVKKWENGHISNMRRDKIEKLAKILQISPVRLLGIKERVTVQEPTENDNLSQLLISYNKLNDLGKEKAVERIEELTEIEKYIK